MNKKIQKAIVFISLIFIASGGFNYGFTKFFGAIPFVIIGAFVSLKILKNYFLFSTVVSLGAICFMINMNLEKSSCIFPILQDGRITINKDGFLITFSDGSSLFSEVNKDEVTCLNCGEVAIKRLTKGEVYPVTGIHIGSSEYTTQIGLVTSIGRISERELELGNISANKEVENRVIKYAGALMFYPAIPIYLLGMLGFLKSMIFG